MTAILLLGKNGQVGHALDRILSATHAVTSLDASDLDLAQADQIREAVRRIRPRLIVNAAAYTAVDRAEDEPDLAMAVNGLAPAVLAEEAQRIGAALIHYSTDYVFDGAKACPYTEQDAPHPLGVYGRTKLAGDEAVASSGAPHLIFRTAWVYGLRGRNFLLTMQRLLGEREEVRVVGDQLGAPTWCELIAGGTAQIIAQGGDHVVSYVERHAGLYNMTCTGETSWYGFARAIRADMGAGPLARLTEIAARDYPTRASRPAYSVLDNTRIRTTFGVALPDWEDALRMALARG